MGETAETVEIAETPETAETTDRRPPVSRAVRVRYEPRGFGLALVVDGGDPIPGGDPTEPGVLRVSDAVVTLEIPLPDGSRSTLSWDPAEVAVDPLVA